ncbi:MAG: sulfurtransferase [Alphaproteobacteria bacterium]|nr:sulfurtransferase [Alphaproteobacteria bacterium]
MTALFTAAELKSVLNHPHVRILDASYNQPPAAEGIPGAVDFDIDDIANKGAPFAHTVPTAEVFAAKVGALGISNEDLVVIYDRKGLSMAAARAWWMFRLFGHENVRVLDGGLPAWIAAGFATAEKTATPKPAVFTAKMNNALFRQVEQVAGNLLRKEFSLIDARDAQRFEAGHIPDSFNIPYATLITAAGSLKPRAELEKAFAGAHIAPQKKITCSCGSGVTACVLALALFELGNKDAAVYDGSWTEWSSLPVLPKMTGVRAS